MTGGRRKLFFLHGVQRKAQGLQTDSHRIPETVLHQDLTLVFLSPQIIPGSDRVLSQLFFVVHDSRDAVLIGYGIPIPGIIGLVCDFQIPPSDILIVRHGFRVDLRQQALVNHPLHHVVGRTDHIVNTRAVFDDRVHLLHSIIGVQNHFNSGFLLKTFYNSGIDVIAVAEDADLLFIPMSASRHRASTDNDHYHRQQCGKHSAYFVIPEQPHRKSHPPLRRGRTLHWRSSARSER